MARDSAAPIKKASSNLDLVERAERDGSNLRLMLDLTTAKPTDRDTFFAQENPDTPLSGIIAASLNNNVVDTRYALKHPDTIYSKKIIGRFGGISGIPLTPEMIQWATKKENADMKIAKIIGNRLNETQMTPEIKELAFGKLRKTKFAEGVASNQYFGEKNLETNAYVISVDKPKTLAYIDHMLYSPNDGFSRGLATNTTLIIRDSKEFIWKYKTFNESQTAGLLAENLSWIEGLHTYPSEQFIMKNYKSPLSIGHVKNPGYYASNVIREFLKELAKKEPDAEILYAATSNPAYLENLSEKELDGELKFALETPSNYTKGLAQSLPYTFLTKLNKVAINNPHDRYLAIGFINRRNYHFTREFLNFVLSEENLKRPNALVLEFLSSDKYVPSSEIWRRATTNHEYRFIEEALRRNPYMNLLVATKN